MERRNDGIYRAIETVRLRRPEKKEQERERERGIGQGRSYSGVFMSDATFALSYEAGAVAEAGLDHRYRYPSAALR